MFGSSECQEWELGRWVRSSTTPALLRYDHSAGHAWGAGGQEDVWCGLIPTSFLAYWPNVIQMIIFTVFQNTGTTIMLAWQGIAGTLCATLNLYFMMFLFPEGAKGPEYIEWIAWLDLVVVVFLFLISLAETNTIKFGMSWHVYFMMGFMNPATGPSRGHLRTWIPGVEWDSEASAVFYTTLAGSTLAVLSTYLPYPMLNITRIDEDSASACSALASIWTEAIEYFCGDARTAKCFQLEAKIMALSSTISRIQGNLAASWWETFDMGKFGRKRELYTALREELASLDHVMYAMKGSLLEEDFLGEHNTFCDERMQMAMVGLKDAAAGLMHLCARCCEDGSIDAAERDSLAACVAVTRAAQAALLKAYSGGHRAQRLQHVSEDLSNENIFVYALSVWAARITAFVENRLLAPDGPPAPRAGVGWRGLWSPAKMLEHHHLSFCGRNLISIIICFLMGYYFQGSIFTGYTSSLAGTLTLLISRYAGTAFEKNVHRLLGTSLGKVLPILVMSMVNYFPCGEEARFCVHASLIFLYVFVFIYVYFTSLQWSSVGCNCAAFGCPFLFAPCVLGADLAETFKSRYAEIGQVTCAIIVQMVVDACLKSRSTREIAVDHVRALGVACEDGFTAFFDGEAALEGHLVRMRSALQGAEDFLPHTDPKVSVVPGPKTPFKADLYARAIENLRLLVSDFEMLALAVRRRKEGHVFENLHNKAAMQIIRRDLLDTLSSALRALVVILEHSTEEAITDSDVLDLENIRGVLELEGVDSLIAQLNEGGAIVSGDDAQELCGDVTVRLIVAIKALRNATMHIGAIDTWVLTKNIH